jgi:two-component system chemotaxis response regulator CheY
MIRILVVDDSSTMRRIVAHNLEQTALDIEKIHFATEGNEALEILGGQPVDVVLTDLNMPGLDGAGLVRAMRARGSTTPVIVLSTSEAASRVDDALAAGAQGFVPKPFSPEQLAQVLQPLLASRS